MFLLTLSILVLIWVATGGVHWGTAALLTICGVIAGAMAVVLSSLQAHHRLNGAYWAQRLDIRRFHGFGALGWMLLAMMLMTVVSLVPLPLEVLEILSPAAAEWYREAWTVAGLDHHWGRLTASGGRTAFALWMLTGFFGLYLFAVYFGGTRRRLSQSSHVLAVVGAVFVAMMGLRFIGHPISFGALGAQSAWHIGLPVNSNHLSGVMAMLSLMALGVILTKRHRNVYARRALWAFFYLVFGVSLIMLKSRGAILAWGLGHLGVIGLYFASLHQIKWKAGIGIAGGLSVIIAAALVVSAPTVGQIAQEYIETEMSFEADDEFLILAENDRKTMSKTQLYADFWPMAKDWGRTGIGRSAFYDVYPVYQGFSFPKRFRHAENEGLEIWLEFGWLGGLLCLILGAVGIFAFVRMCWKQSDESKLVIGYVAAILAISLQNLFDFGLRYWSVGFLFWLLCGILESRRQRWKYGKIEKDTEPASLRVRIAFGVGMGIWIIAMITSLACAGLAVEGQTEKGLNILRQSPTPEHCAENLSVRPGSPDVRKIMGFAHIEASDGSQSEEQHLLWLEARRWLESAHQKAPREARISLHLAKTCLALDDLDCAVRHFQYAMQNNPKLRTLAMYEMASLPKQYLQLPGDAVHREGLIRALNDRKRFDIAFELTSKLEKNAEFSVEYINLMCIIYDTMRFTEGCDALVEQLADLPQTLVHLNLKSQYMIRHQAWPELFNLYETTENSFKHEREYWRKRLYHSVFYGKHRDSGWYHDAISAIFLRYRQISDGDRLWRFDDAYCGAFYALEMGQLSRAVRNAKAALAIRPRHVGAANILKEAENRQKNSF